MIKTPFFAVHTIIIFSLTIYLVFLNFFNNSAHWKQRPEFSGAKNPSSGERGDILAAATKAGSTQLAMYSFSRITFTFSWLVFVSQMFYTVGLSTLDNQPTAYQLESCGEVK